MNEDKLDNLVERSIRLEERQQALESINKKLVADVEILTDKVSKRGAYVTGVATAVSVMWLCRRLGVSDGLGGIMGAGTGVCGVSAIIATAPVVNAKPRDMAYAIGTILLFGTLMLFVMPYIGRALDISEPQFGAWAAVAILNTAQLIAEEKVVGLHSRVVVVGKIDRVDPTGGVGFVLADVLDCPVDREARAGESG